MPLKISITRYHYYIAVSVLSPVILVIEAVVDYRSSACEALNKTLFNYFKKHSLLFNEDFKCIKGGNHDSFKKPLARSSRG